MNSSTERTRIIDAGTVGPVTSQALYHAVTRSVGEGADDTVVLARPGAPYVSLGYHYTTAAVDLEYCERADLPVFRRKIGGGLVYLDADQLFIQFCFGDLPRHRGAAYEYLMSPLVETLDGVGVAGGLSDGFDLTANGKKIGGIGAGEIDGAGAVTTSILFDFDWEAATNIHQTPTERFHEYLGETMATGVTTLDRELASRPDWDTVKTACIENCKAAFPEPYVGSLSDREEELLDEERDRLLSEEFLHLITDEPDNRRVKVTDGVFLRLCHLDGFETPLMIEERNGTVEDIQATEGTLPFEPDRVLGMDIDEGIEALESQVSVH